MAKGAQAKNAKAEAADKKAREAAAAKEAAEESKWSEGSKGKGGKASKDAKAEKAAAEAARKAEAARLLAEEEAELDRAAKKSAGASKKAPAKKATPKSVSAPSKSIPDFDALADQEPEVTSYAGTGIDNALDILDLTAGKSDKATLGSKAAKAVDTHPERRFKAAFETYKETRLPDLRKEHPGLRLQQYQDLMYKEFQKHPDNPFNQVTASFDATKEEKLAALERVRKEKEQRLKAT